MVKHRRARRRSGRRGSMRVHRGSHNIPILPVIGVAAGIGIPALNAWNNTKGAPTALRVQGILDQIGTSIYGYSVGGSQWNTALLPQFWAPVAGSTIAHIFANKIGLNRILSRAKVGFTL